MGVVVMDNKTGKWVVVITEGDSLKRMVFDSPEPLLYAMEAVVRAAQVWTSAHFKQWVNHAKPGQWIELRDAENRVRVLVLRSTNMGQWWVL